MYHLIIIEDFCQEDGLYKPFLGSKNTLAKPSREKYKLCSKLIYLQDLIKDKNNTECRSNTNSPVHHLFFFDFKWISFVCMFGIDFYGELFAKVIGLNLTIIKLSNKCKKKIFRGRIWLLLIQPVPQKGLVSPGKYLPYSHKINHTFELCELFRTFEDVDQHLTLNFLVP